MAGAGSFRRSARVGGLRLLPSVKCRSPSPYKPNLTFAPGQDGCAEHRIGALAAAHQAKKRLYYGIEVLARFRRDPITLDFNRFLPVLPIFISVVWHSLRYWDVEPIGKVDSLVLCKHLAEKIPALPHMTAYRMSRERLRDFLALGFRNVLALRGDDVDPDQDIKLAKSMVEQAKCNLGEKISVTVAGFPEGYTSLDRGPADFERNMKFLKAKIDAGADCIITQACYRPEAIVKFVKDCRAAGIKVPILIGIMAHDTHLSYTKMEKKAGVHLPPDLLEELNQLQCQMEAEPNKDPDLISKFFVRTNVRIICHILSACEDIWGIVFFTLNRFENTEATLKELHALNLLKSPD